MFNLKKGSIDTRQTQKTSLPKQQQGVALLTILLMVVVATVLATTMIVKQQRFIQETAVLLRQDQSVAFAQAAEQMAIVMLNEDDKVNQTDSLQDLWAKKANKLPVDGGSVSFKIKEQSGKFNINNLMQAGKVNQDQFDYFKRLLAQLGLEEALAEAVLDWQDADDATTGKGGAEIDFYAAQNIQPANQPFADITELKKVRGFTANAYAALAPHVIALPRLTKININTASLPVLTALADNVDASAVLNLIEQRAKAEPLKNVDELFTQSPFAGIDAKVQKKIKPLLDVKSQVFQVNTQITLDDRKTHLTSHLFKKKGVVVTYQRALVPFFFD